MKKITLFKTMFVAIPFIFCNISVSGQVVLSQIYGGGGNSGATYKNDFIELFNRGSVAVSLNGWSVQYASATGTTWTNQTNLPDVILNPGQYFLIQEAAGNNGTTDLPTPDATGTIIMSGTAGKVALCNNTTALTSADFTTFNPTGSSIVDFVGYGTTATNYEGNSPTSAPSNTTSIFRSSGGYVDTNLNSADFTTGTPNPKNSLNYQNPSTSLIPTFNIAAGKNIDIHSLYGNIIISTSVNQTIEIFNSVGQILFIRKAVEGVNTIPVSVKGLVLVKVGNQISKVIM